MILASMYDLEFHRIESMYPIFLSLNFGSFTSRVLRVCLSK